MAGGYRKHVVLQQLGGTGTQLALADRLAVRRRLRAERQRWQPAGVRAVGEAAAEGWGVWVAAAPDSLPAPLQAPRGDEDRDGEDKRSGQACKGVTATQAKGGSVGQGREHVQGNLGTACRGAQSRADATGDTLATWQGEWAEPPGGMGRLAR